MDTQHNDRYGDENHYRTHRSERYRHPEQGNNYNRQDDRQRYGNSGARHTANHSMNEDTYSTSRNYGNMGSYGGAQGFGTARGGHHPAQHYDSSGYNYYSGMGSPDEARQSNLNSPGNQNRYGGYAADENNNRDSDSGMRSNANNRDLYGTDTSRRFEGSDQNRYHFNDEDDYSSHSYGGGQRGGNYMGSGYERDDRPDNYRGFWGSRDGYAHGGDNGSSSERYGMSGYFGGSNNNAESDYIRSQNQNRTFSRHHDRRDGNRGYDRY